MPSWIVSPPDLDELKLSDKDNDPLIYEKEIAYVGEFYKKSDDLEFQIDERFIDHWVNTQASMLEEGVEVPMPWEHNLNAPRKSTALEYVKKLDSKGRTGLFAKVKFKDEETAKELKDSQTSIYVEKEFTSGKKKKGEYKKYELPITHIAWTEYPVLPGMDKAVKIAASLNATQVFPKEFFTKDDDMKLSELALSLGLEIGDKEPTKDDIVAAFSQLKEDNTKLENSISELKKQIPEPENKPFISASMIDVMTENRQLKLDKLQDDGYITAAQHKELSGKYLNKECVTLSCSSKTPTDDFSFVIKTLELGHKQPLHGEEESGFNINDEYILKLSDSDLNDPKKNPLHKAIAAMSE